MEFKKNLHQGTRLYRIGINILSWPGKLLCIRESTTVFLLKLWNALPGQGRNSFH